MLLMINPDEFPHSDLAYPLWIKTHITPTQLKAGVTADKKDVIPFESPSPNFGIHRYQFLLYPQKGKTVMLKSKLALTRLLRVAEFEGYNKVRPVFSYQYVIVAERGISTASDLLSQRNSSLFMIIFTFFGWLLS
ncbi:Hypothetical predicted protein [Octopus vulgaris]|uniref:Uncharacterized protein n=1 Tax=Octopus vulgaris TaxID=6645 RepID=A0AA36B8Z6_OCTVU|nr:Hypothetical predicted protein [Octopus vulgaris]